ncbi:MAG: hypothetical protein ACK4YX_11955 [Rhabdaerophilum calidifontis]
MADPHPPALLSLAATLDPVLAQLAPVAPVEVAPAAAIGAVAATTILAPGPVPACARALKDGFAVEAAAPAGASAYEPLPLAPPARLVGAGEALPPGCDAVLPADAVQMEGGLAQALAAAFPGENVRLAGDDLAAGATIATAGTRIGPRAALAAAQAGISRLLIRRPRFRIAAEDGADPGLAALIGALAGAFGHRPVAAGAEPDILIRCDAGAPPRLAVNGGIPAGLMLTPEGRPVLTLAPRFDAALAGFLVLGLPILAARAGLTPPLEALPLATKVSSAIGMSDTILLRRVGAAWRPLATGAIPLQALMEAEAVAIAPAMLEGYAAGEVLAALRLGALLGE